MSAQVAVRPAIASAVDDAREEIIRNIVAEVVALVDGRPEIAGLRGDSESDCIAQTGRVNPRVAAIGISDDHGRPSRVRFDRDVRLRSDRCEEVFSIGAERDRARPMLVVAQAGQLLDSLGRSEPLGRSRVVSKSYDFVRAGDVHIVVVKGDAERQVETFSEYLTRRESVLQV